MNEPNDYDRLLLPISEQDRIRGSLDAPVKLLEYGDYQSYLSMAIAILGIWI